MSSKAQRTITIGKEAVPGDGATVDVGLLAKATLKAVVDKRVPDEDTGFAPRRHYIGSKRGEGSLEAELVYQQMPYFVSMAIGAGTVTGTAPKLWSFALPVSTTAPTFATYNMEYSDGDDHIVRCKDVFATDMEISGEAGGAWMLKSSLTGGDVTFPAAVGASPAPPAPVDTILMAQTTLTFADDGEFASGVVMGTLISFTYKLANLQHSKLFAGSLFPNGRGHNRWEVTLELLVETTHTEVEVQKDKLFNTAQTYIQVQADYPDGGGTGVDWRASITGAFFLQDVGTPEDRDGNNTLKLVFMGEKESDTLNSSVGVYVDNDLAAL